MASGPITSWQIDREKMEAVRNFIFLSSKITADDDLNHEIKRCLLLGKKAMTNLDNLLKSRGITFPTKVHVVKARAFPVVIYRCESLTVKKAEYWRIDAFQLCVREDFCKFLGLQGRSNQSILKEISPGCSLEGLMLKLKLQYFGYLMQRTDSLKKTLMLEKIKGRWKRGDREWDGWMDSPTQWTCIWAHYGSWWWAGRPGVLQFMESQRVSDSWVTELNWTELKTVGTLERKELLKCVC